MMSLFKRIREKESTCYAAGSVAAVKLKIPGGKMGFKKNQDTDGHLQSWLSRNQHMNGARVLSYLITNPNTPVHTSFLDWCNCHKRWPEICAEAIGGFESQSSIPQTDRQALREYRKAANVLIKKIEGAVFLGNAELEERLRSEYDQINRHIRQVTDPKGHIKSFDPYWKKAYHRVFTCTAKTLKKLASADQELADFACEHLIKGQQFMWRDPLLPVCQYNFRFDNYEVRYEVAD